VLATVNGSADVGAERSRCTCPNVSASWNASANSARYEPHLDRDRSQFIVVALRASRIGRRPISADRCRDISNNVTLRQLAAVDSSIDQFRFLFACCKKSSVSAARRDAPQPTLRACSCGQSAAFAHPGRGQTSDEQQEADESGEYRQHPDAAHYAGFAYPEP